MARLVDAVIKTLHAGIHRGLKFDNKLLYRMQSITERQRCRERGSEMTGRIDASISYAPGRVTEVQKVEKT